MTHIILLVLAVLLPVIALLWLLERTRLGRWLRNLALWVIIVTGVIAVLTVILQLAK